MNINPSLHCNLFISYESFTSSPCSFSFPATTFSTYHISPFTPSPSSYAFINGIEVVSMPESLYFNSGNEDTGMYRSWDKDDSHIFGSANGLTPDYEQTPITYTTETPNYTAPKLVYQTQRSMGKLSDKYNLTWILPVDSAFFYNLRLHFCNIIPQYNKTGQVVVKIFINNQTAEDEIDLFFLTRGTGYPVFKDYVVFVDDPDGSSGKQYLWVAMHPNSNSELYHDCLIERFGSLQAKLIR